MDRAKKDESAGGDCLSGECQAQSATKRDTRMQTPPVDMCDGWIVQHEVRKGIRVVDSSRWTGKAGGRVRVARVPCIIALLPAEDERFVLLPNWPVTVRMREASASSSSSNR